MSELVLTFTGPVPPKKNSLRRVMRGGRLLSIPSEAHEKWENRELASLANAPCIPGAVLITYDFWVGGKEIPKLFDFDNATASINDLLQKASIISGDDWAMLPQPTPRLRGFVRGEQRTVVTIKSVEAPWLPLLATLRDADAVRALAKANGVTQKYQRELLWTELTSIEVAA
jgi:hypothetical protein